MNDEALKTLAYGVIAALIFAAGWAVEGWRMGKKISDIEKTHVESQLKSSAENTQALASANARADVLALKLAGWEVTLNAFAEEKNREISRLVTGRRCLDAGVVRVLNREIIPSRSGGALSQTPGLVLRPDAAATAPADDREFATDNDVAQWVGVCKRSYDACRGRLEMISDFYAKGGVNE